MLFSNTFPVHFVSLTCLMSTKVGTGIQKTVNQKTVSHIIKCKSYYMKEIFYLSPYATHKKHDIYVQSSNTMKYGSQSLRVLRAHIWHSLPEKIKNLTSLNRFKGYIKTWNGPECNCYLSR